MNGFVRLRFAPTYVGDYNTVFVDVSPPTCPIRATARVHLPHATPLEHNRGPALPPGPVFVEVLAGSKPLNDLPPIRKDRLARQATSGQTNSRNARRRHR